MYKIIVLFCNLLIIVSLQNNNINSSIVLILINKFIAIILFILLYVYYTSQYILYKLHYNFKPILLKQLKHTKRLIVKKFHLQILHC